MTNLKKTTRQAEGAEYGMDSRYSSKKEMLEEGKALMEARLHRMKNLSPDQIVKARLVQLKLKMEEFIEEPTIQKDRPFTRFLASYIDIIYAKRQNFAEDMEITPILLSQLLNSHREPKKEFMLKLMVHSTKTYKDICPFNEKIWYQVFYQERLADMMAHQDEWRPHVEKHVHTRRLRKIAN